MRFREFRVSLSASIYFNLPSSTSPVEKAQSRHAKQKETRSYSRWIASCSFRTLLGHFQIAIERQTKDSKHEIKILDVTETPIISR